MSVGMFFITKLVNLSIAGLLIKPLSASNLPSSICYSDWILYNLVEIVQVYVSYVALSSRAWAHTVCCCFHSKGVSANVLVKEASQHCQVSGEEEVRRVGCHCNECNQQPIWSSVKDHILNITCMDLVFGMVISSTSNILNYAF